MNNITICTQIKNRFYQFEQTFNHNISIINKYDNVNWTIVDIQSNDGLENFFEQFLKSYDHNNINYYKIINNVLPFAFEMIYNLLAMNCLFRS